MLHAHTLLSHDGIEIADVACRDAGGSAGDAEHASAYGIVFVRRGCFVRRADGAEALFDPTAAYCMTPGQEQRYVHPHSSGDDCTALFLAPDLVASLWGGEPTLPAAPLQTGPEVDLEHRMLLAAAHRGADHHEVFELALGLAARVLERADTRRVHSGRPASIRERRQLVDGVRTALADDPGRTQLELARAMSVSPHHLSRVFRSLTGHTISRHRARLRVRAALERLAGGDDDLARVAADEGFADQSHLCRLVRQETGSTPSALRAALAGAPMV
jgi:AraC-like DNA-binding protein